ncbi:TlpA family protein disulfide reductase [Dyadobacter sp. BHUBP1]|uniref:TlpA family protein disulfide reductase n=1 Tax=Dyadobacter sp. BHUBP1 TaxID=3424178 RepID=UPI003D348F2E
MFDYALIASNFYQHKIYNAVYDEHESADWDSLEPIFPTLVEEKIKSGKYPRLIEDFFRVKAADHQWGIPRYLLIDAQGRMVATHAPRPSSEDVQAELRRLLTVNRVAQK